MILRVTAAQVQDYALWEVIENDNVKARSLLLMALPNEHQLTFSQYNDAKIMFAAIETRFGGNEATKKTEGTFQSKHTVSPNVNTASPQVSTASFSDNVVYAFMVKNPNGSNLLQQDLEQIHKDDLEAIDLKLQLSLLRMRAKRECRAPRNKEGQFRNQDNTRKHGNNEDTSSKAMLAIDCVGFDWSDMAEEQVQTNMALMAFSDSEQEKEGIEFKIEKFDKASKDLDKLLGSQITDKSKKGLGYSVVPPPHPLIYNRPKKLDLSYSGLDEFKEPEFKPYGYEDSKQESNIVCDKKSYDSKENFDDSLAHYQREKMVYGNNYNSFDMKNIVPKESLTCLVAKATLDESMLWHRRLGHINFKNINKLVKDNLNGVAERRNRTLIEAARTMLADSKLPTTFWAEAVSTACYVQNMVLVVKPHNKTPYELFRGLKPVLNFMRPFGCHVTILNTLDNLGKFDGKSDEGFFIGYSLSSKAFKVSIAIESAGYKGELMQIHLIQKLRNQSRLHFTVQDNENDKKYKSEDDSGTKKVNVVGQHVNTTSPEVITVDLSLNTASSNDQDSPKDMFKIGASHTLEATPVEFFSDEDELEVDLGNILNSYTVEAMQEELLQFKLQQVWILVDLPIGKRDIEAKWVFRNKKDKRGIVIRNKARLVAQGHRQEKGIDYEEVFSLMARIEAIRLFLAYASFMGFLVYQMDVKSAFLYGTIEEEVYVTQPTGFKDPNHPDKVYKVVKALYGLH
ncbi:retrovirus-related pol polyprotein from transposon TNT 1-94 [Tanacetum coccineum]